MTWTVPSYTDPAIDWHDKNFKKYSVKHYTDYMLARTQSMFEYSGLPSTIPARTLELYLQTGGYAAIIPVAGDLYVVYGGLGGLLDANYMPTVFTFANPAISRMLKKEESYKHQLKIGEECVVLSNDSLYKGLLPMFGRYASMLTENDISMRMASIMMRSPIGISAGDDATKESAELFIKHLEDGKMSVIGEDTMLTQGVRSMSFTSSADVAGQLIEYQQYLKAGWFNELGLNANYNMKREAINADEAQMNHDALLPLVDDMLRCRQIGIDAVNDMFGTSITVKLASSWEDLQIEEELEHEIAAAQIESLDNEEDPEEVSEDVSEDE